MEKRFDDPFGVPAANASWAMACLPFVCPVCRKTVQGDSAACARDTGECYECFRASMHEAWRAEQDRLRVPPPCQDCGGLHDPLDVDECEATMRENRGQL